MPLETGTYVSDLVPSNPAHTDGLNNADAHARLIKNTIKNTFPNIAGAVTATQADLNELGTGVVTLANGTSGAPSLTFDTEATLGLRKSSTGHMSVTGGVLRGNGVKAPGEYEWWPFVPANMATAGTYTGAAAAIERIECDGSSYLITDFPDIGALFPNDGTHFTVPNAKDTGRYLRSRTSTLAVGTAQANVFKTHTHEVTGATAADGNHNHGGSTGGASVDHTHTVPYSTQQAGIGGGGSQFQFHIDGGTFNTTTSGFSQDHSHAISNSGTHTHAIDIVSQATGDATETRPETLVAILCVHT